MPMNGTSQVIGTCIERFPRPCILYQILLLFSSQTSSIFQKCENETWKIGLQLYWFPLFLFQWIMRRWRLYIDKVLYTFLGFQLIFLLTLISWYNLFKVQNQLLPSPIWDHAACLIFFKILDIKLCVHLFKTISLELSF